MCYLCHHCYYNRNVLPSRASLLLTEGFKPSRYRCKYVPMCTRSDDNKLFIHLRIRMFITYHILNLQRMNQRHLNAPQDFVVSPSGYAASDNTSCTNRHLACRGRIYDLYLTTSAVDNPLLLSVCPDASSRFQRLQSAPCTHQQPCLPPRDKTPLSQIHLHRSHDSVSCILPSRHPAS